MNRKDLDARSPPDRAAYETPRLVLVGTFENITQATGSGARLDTTFTEGTPADDLTLS